MVPASSQQPVYRSGEWEIDLGRRELRTRGSAVSIGGRAFEILGILVQSAGDLVTKDTLMGRVWPGAIVGEHTLHVHISAIRKALGPARGMLTTASGRGYRLVGTWAIRQENEPVERADAAPGVGSRALFWTNLPFGISALIGRAAAAQELRDLLSAYRGITLTGPGGIGKTALAVEVARNLFPTFHGDVGLVELASLSDPLLTPAAAAGALGLKVGGNEITAESVARAIGAKKLLLVLDNCEHVIDMAAKLVETVLRKCPQVTVLATSREVLRVEGECVYRVAPLDVPSKEEEELGDVLGCGAVQLFIAKMGLLHLESSQHKDDLSAISAICRRLDGIPLAIGFAAARAATLGPRQVAAYLNDRFSLLTAGRRTALPRHQTLRATLDWSYQLLADLEQRVLCRLAVFADAFLLEEGAAVAASCEVATPQIAESIASLVAKSLVATDVGSATIRYRLLETTRAYALEKLVEREEFQAAAHRHAEYYCGLFTAAGVDWGATPTPERTADYRRRIDDVRAALGWAFSPGGEASIAVALTIAAVPLWFDLSALTEARARIEQALLSIGSGSNQDARRKMQLLAALGATLLITRGGLGPKMAAAWTEALAIAETLDDSDYRLRALWGLFVERLSVGRYRDALTLGEQFRTLAAASIDPAEPLIGERMTAVALHILGNQAEARKRLRHVLNHYTAAVRRSDFTRFQFDQRVATRSFYSRVTWLQGFPDQALRAVEETIGDARALDHPTSLFYALTQAACPIALLAGELAMAERLVNVLLDLSVVHPKSRSWR